MDLILSKDRYYVSIQGEGLTIGKPSIFLRLQGCNLNCKWCDTRFTWDEDDPDFKAFGRFLVDDLVEVFSKMNVRNLVITGGEPLLQQEAVLDLITALSKVTDLWTFEIETNGTLSPSFRYQSLPILFNVSPKLSGSGIRKEIRYDEYVLRDLDRNFNSIFKFAISSMEDVQEVNEIVESCGIRPEKIFLMPVGTTMAEMITKPHSLGLVHTCIERGYNLSTRLQIILWGSKQGV